MVYSSRLKKDIVFQRAAENYSLLLERLTIQIQLSRRRWATLPNLYVTPVKKPTSADYLVLDNISVGPSIIMGIPHTSIKLLGGQAQPTLVLLLRRVPRALEADHVSVITFSGSVVRTLSGAERTQKNVRMAGKLIQVVMICHPLNIIVERL